MDNKQLIHDEIQKIIQKIDSKAVDKKHDMMFLDKYNKIQAFEKALLEDGAQVKVKEVGDKMIIGIDFNKDGKLDDLKVMEHFNGCLTKIDYDFGADGSFDAQIVVHHGKRKEVYYDFDYDGFIDMNEEE